jgi:hypothetical protein
MAGRKRDVSFAADASHCLSNIRCLLKILLTNQLNDTESSLALSRQVFGHQEFADFRSLNEQHFHDLRKC